MHGSIHVRRLALVLFLLLSAAAAPALGQTPQAAPQQAFQPHVGQGGKDVVWVPTPDGLVGKMLEMAKVTPDDFVIDLGSGDGRTVIAAAKRGARALGVEYNPDMVELSRQNAEKAGVADRVEFVKADLFETDLSKATVVTLFLLPDINLKLRPKLLDLAPGTRIVSNTFTMADWEADETAGVGPGCTAWCNALMWIVPAKVAGTWTAGDGELRLGQDFQKVSGTLRRGSTTTAIGEGRLRGDRISFTAGGTSYTGTVNGPRIEGTAVTGSASVPWTATRAGQ